ncbi:hypothetical protein [Parenemella sanctibonifatiensis]|uniref:Uncharacterized protein n=1 Tax=Parenemella sanctibonifatiensis TaxID=2016505 RepID=A0A255EP50_9ACTN|nr:hypothetical protein [Parenemella sanctibonifatiensis]OYN92741.1 hypothetical protein CGZ91_04575 [Parenemella sanctibonifatiensis]
MSVGLPPQQMEAAKRRKPKQVAPAPGWIMPEEQSAEHSEAYNATHGPSQAAVVHTGPSGLLVGEAAGGPVTVRLFRNRPTRILTTVPEYMLWLFAFRCVSLGAHLSILADEHRRWQALAGTVERCGGTVDLLGKGGVVPSQGRPYRPSLVVDDASFYDGLQAPLGPWQAMLAQVDAAASGAVHWLRSADMALLSPANSRTVENLRRAYALNQRQTKMCANLDGNEAVLVMPRRVVRVQIPPTQSEYRLLFGG